MSLNKLTSVEIGRSLGLKIGADVVDCVNMVCNQVNMPPGGCIDAHDIVVSNELKVDGTTDIGGNNYVTPDVGQVNYSLHTDGAGSTFWSPDDTGSGDITYDGVPPTEAGQLVMFSSIDGSTARQSQIKDDGVSVSFSTQDIIDVDTLSTTTVETHNLTVGTGILATQYTLPNTRGAVDQVIKTDGAGGCTWEDADANNQPLNTTDDVSFNSVTTGVINGLGGSKLIELRDTVIIGTIGGANGSLLIQTDNTGLPDLGFNVGGSSVFRLCAIGGGGFFHTEPGGFEWTGTTIKFLNKLEINEDLTIGTAIPATQYILPSTRGTVNQILKTDVSGVVTWESSPFDQDLNEADVARFGGLRVGIPPTEYIMPGSRGLNNNILKTNATGVVSWASSPFDQDLNTGDAVEFLSVKTPTIDNSGAFLTLGATSLGMSIGQFNTDLTAKGGLIVNQTSTLRGAVSVGIPGVNDYQLPSSRGMYGDVLRAGTGSSVSWAPNGSYSQSGATITVSNTAVKTSLVSSGIGSLVIPEIYAGCSYHLRTGGTIETENKDQDLTVTVELNGVKVYEMSAVDLDDVATTGVYEHEIDIVCKTDGVAGAFYANGQFFYSKDLGAGGFKGFNTEYDSVINTTVSNTMVVYLTWGSAQTNNIFTCKMLQLNKTF